MMYKYPIILVCLLLLRGTISVYALEDNKSYILVYENLYDYGKNTSDVLLLYTSMKSAGYDVILLPIDESDKVLVSSNEIIIVLKENFESEKKYEKFVNKNKSNKITVLDKKLSLLNECDKNKGLMIAIDEIYPFSNLNKVMDMAEFLNGKGIEFICNVMPVYENYEQEAFSKYIEVLKYVNKKGGQLFINYPVDNEAGTYNFDTKTLFKTAIEEFRKRGLNIKGISLPQDKLFNNTEIFQHSDLPFLLIKESNTKIDENLNLYDRSKIINNYILMRASSIDKFNIFSYLRNYKLFNPQVICISADEDEQKLNRFLEELKSQKIFMKDIAVKNEYAYDNFYNSEVLKNDLPQQSKSELEKFKEEEMKKIKGENLKPEKSVKGSYDISRFARISIRAAAIVALMFVIQILIGKRFDIKKFFKSDGE